MSSSATGTVTRLAEVNFAHLQAMTDDVGLFEHATGREPAREHGYCVDDVSRGLVVVLREPEIGGDLLRLAEVYLAFLLESQAPDGLIANRKSTRGRWTTKASVGDWWGRAVWGLGAAARAFPDEQVRATALEAVERSMQRRAPWSRSMAFATLGAAEVLAAHPGHAGALELLADAVPVMGRPRPGVSATGASARPGASATGASARPRASATGASARPGAWRWPAERLTYGNASVAEVLIAAGQLGGDSRALDDGLALLEWLLDLETVDGHLSVTPAGGAGPSLERPAFDQQPIEVAAMADACARAAEATGDDGWLRGVNLAIGWMLGDNDTGVVMYDESTGGGFDGLTGTGRNGNCGAESTLAALSVLQHARRLNRMVTT